MLRNVITVIDGAAGSCGKAKVIGEIATDKRIKLGASVTNCMPNAGHTFVDEFGRKTIFRNIPVSIINKDTELFIGPGSAIDMEVFIEEYERIQPYLGDRKIYVHPMVPLIENRHKEYEREHLKSGSTYKGGGGALKEKVIRDERLKFFETYKNAIRCTNSEWLERLHSHLDSRFEYVMLEGSQGCDLGLNFSDNYPYVTSREVSAAQLVSDSGIPLDSHLQTIMVIRPFPIRISNITNNGEYIYTGSYGTGRELSWSEINIAAMTKTYPHEGNLTLFDYVLDKYYLESLLKELPEVYLMQLFGSNYQNASISDINLNKALELERLYYKAKGISEYESEIIDLSCFSEAKDEVNIITDLSEQTTVTKKERRIFDLDIEKLKCNCLKNKPSGLYLNFFQHLSLDYQGVTGTYEDVYIDHYLREYLNWLESETNSEIVALGTGAQNGERILKKSIVKPIE